MYNLDGIFGTYDLVAAQTCYSAECNSDYGESELGIPTKMLDCGLEMPSYAHQGDAGMDLRSTVELTLKPFERALVPCGVAMAIPDGYCGLAIPRSGLAINHGISIVNAPGLIDSNFRGEFKIVLINLDPHEEFHVNRGDRIAQVVIVKVEQGNLIPVDTLPESSRGEGGFGSSGLQ